MLVTKPYNRERAVEYARRWAFSRNPLFNDYTGIGGNCTNFVSQSLYAGSCTMNFTPIFGWYYLSDTERTASWSGVEFFYNFLTSNRGVGPFGREVAPEAIELGDVIQLAREETGYYHTLLVVGFSDGVPLVAAQSDDALDRPLDSYTYDYARYLKIDGVRLRVENTEDCFDSLYGGIAIIPAETV
ncbi:MAG: amidase domain-containing protein [Clostridia bacterium]|nr:amidase domain-containing protein [Clostridia bacterium]